MSWHFRGVCFMGKYFKMFLCFILAFSMVCIPYLNSEAKSIVHYKEYNSLVITGHIPQENLLNYGSRSVSVQLINNDEIIYLDEASVESDGTYQFGVYVNEGQNLEDCTLRLRIGNDGASDTVVSAMASYTECVSVPAEVKREGTDITITADFSLIDIVSDDFVTIFAVYSGETNKLKQAKLLNSKNELRNNKLFKAKYHITDISENDIAKIFVWQDFESIIPISYLSDDMITFGNQYRAKTSYDSLSTQNVYKRYSEARKEVINDAEIPEVPDIKTKHEIYVSPYGDDNNDGSINSPYQTFGKAIEVIAGWGNARKSEWKTIYLCDGKYNVDESIVLDKNICDSQGNANIIIKAFDEADVVFTSSKTASASVMKKVTSLPDSEKTRFNQNVIENLYYCDYSDLGISEIKGFTKNSVPSMIYNKKQATISRYPNASDLYIKTVVSSGADGENPVFVPSDMKFLEWGNPDNKIGISGQLIYSWTSSKGLVENIDKTEKTVTVPNDVWTGYSTTEDKIDGIDVVLHNNKLVNSHYFFYNVLEELDMENEWCAEDSTQRVYYYPVGGKVNPNDYFYITDQTECDSVIKVNKANNIYIDGLDFFACEKGIDIQNSENVIVTNSNMIGLTSGLYLYNTTKCGILNSYMEDMGAGVRIVDSKNNIYDLKSDRNFVCNVHMNGVNSHAIYINGGVGNIISHNLMENYQGAMVYIWRGCENIVEYNESIAGALFGNEGASLYVAGQFDSRHNHIRYNYVHHNNLEQSHLQFDNTKASNTGYINDFIAKLNGFGLSVDDLGESEYVYGNLFECLSVGTGVNGGNDNVFDDNYYKNCIVGTSLRGQYSNDYTDKHMFYTELTGRFKMKQDISKSPLLGGYFDSNYNLNESQAYQNRYAYLPERIAWFEHIRDIWPESGENCQEDIYFFAAETGNLMLDNKFSDCIKPEFYSDLAQRYMDTDTDVKSGESPAKYGDYAWLQNNVTYGNNMECSFDKNDVEAYKKAGLLDFSSNVYNENDSKISILCSEENDLGGLDLVWLNRSDANYYKVTLTDSQCTDVLYTFNNYLRTDKEYDNYTVEAYTYRKNSDNLLASS